MKIYAGTSGYSYREWKGSFYPGDLPEREMLRHYGTRLPAVEINNTFYRLPRSPVLESWAAQVPGGFRFAVKASRRITHMKRLRNAGDETAYLLRTLASLGDRLGAILFQLPPQLHGNAAKLRDFLALLPGGTRAAFEFRHPSWRDEEVIDVLRERNCAWCLSDRDGSLLEGDLLRTADWGYVRFRRVDYPDQTLRAVTERLGDGSWKTLYAFFKHEDGPEGPDLARRFLELGSAADTT